MNAIEQLIEQYEKAKKELQSKMKTEFNTLFKEFFEQNPEVTCVGWRQYTPYFNDGDACVFTSYAEYAFATNAQDYTSIQWGEYGGDDENVWICDMDYGDFNEEEIPEGVDKNLEALQRTLAKVPDEVYLELFGNHVVVYATREGFEVEDYEHD